MKINNKYSFKAKVWLYDGEAAWHFISVPQKQTKEIKDMFGVLARGWGSLKVDVTIGKTTWRTSIFPDNKSKTYLLPLKADIRRKEEIHVGQTVKVILEILMYN